jgi:NAD(P)-dependent dehydrogenase (short-subunit alcohol dehydrogenase family)
MTDRTPALAPPAGGPSLAGQGVLVTGGGSGIGLAAAARLARDGAVVTICGRTESRLVDAVATIRASGDVDVEHVVADVTDEDAVARAVGAAAERAGRLHAVVASAGGSESIGPITQLDLDAWSRTLAQNVTGAMLALKHGGAAMVRGGGGSFVALSSLASATSHPWFGAYGPAKAGIDQLVRQAADELGPSGVRVNSVCPGLTRTDLVEFITAGGEVLDDYLANTPLGRFGEPEEVAELIRFLVGPESAWITGQAINIDGGQSVRRGPSLRSVLEPVFGADGLRGVVAPD